jgi:hypothetical protein
MPPPLQAGAAMEYVPLRAPAPVMPPMMPKLPPTPWQAAASPSAHLVQQQYVATRLEELEARRTPGRQAALDALEQMLVEKPPFQRMKKIPFKELMRVYKSIEMNLQSAELTVNFKCDTWFTNENPYDTYTQMYQRAVEGKTMVLRDTDQNQADLRAKVDNAVTFPKSWQGTQAQAPPQRGLMPGRQSPERIQRQMDTGAMTPIHKAGELPAFLAGNKHFNPDTKQVFLALNYGRRAYGSAINYGYSHFVAKGSLRAKCIYYAQDTFKYAKATPKGKRIRVDADAIQYTYDNLGALFYAKGDPHLQEAIFQSCYEGRTLPDPIATVCSSYLVEAHHFGDLAFDKHVEHMVISPKDCADRSLWPTIVANATKFCRRNGVRLFQTD